MSGPNFTELLGSATLGSIEKPKPLPQGSYVAIIKKSEYDKSSKKQTPFVRFHMDIVQAMEDVDEAALEAYGDVSGKSIRTDFYLTEGALFQLQDFILYHIGLDLTGQTLEQAIPECVNQQVGVRIEHEASQDGQNFYARVKETFNPEDA